MSEPHFLCLNHYFGIILPSIDTTHIPIVWCVFAWYCYLMIPISGVCSLPNLNWSGLLLVCYQAYFVACLHFPLNNPQILAHLGYKPLHCPAEGPCLHGLSVLLLSLWPLLLLCLIYFPWFMYMCAYGSSEMLWWFVGSVS